MENFFNDGVKQSGIDGKLSHGNSFKQAIEDSVFKGSQLKENMEMNNMQFTYSDYMKLQSQNQNINNFNNYNFDNTMNNINDQMINMNMNQIENNDKVNFQMNKNMQNNQNFHNMDFNNNNMIYNQNFNPYLMSGPKVMHPSLLEFNNYLNQNNIKVDTEKLKNESLNNIEQNEEKMKSDENNKENFDNIYKDIIDVMESQDDDRMKNSEFLQFMKRLNNGEIKLNEKMNKIDGEINSMKKENFTNNKEINDKINNFDDILNNMNYNEYINQMSDNTLFLKDNPYLNSLEKDNKEGLDRVALAKKLMAEFKADEARQVLEAEVKHCFDNSEAWVLLGRIHSEMDNDELAAECLKNGKTADPYNVDCYHALGISCTNCFEEFEAMEYILEYLKLHPNYSKFVDVNDPLLNSKLISEESKKQNELFSKLTFQNNDMFNNDFYDYEDPNVQKMFTENYNQQQFYDNQYFEARQKIDEMRNNYYNQVIKVFNSISESNIQKDSDFYLAYGIASFIPNMNEVSINAFRKAVEINPNDYNSWNKLGAILAHSKMHENAIDCYKKAIQLKPNYLRCLANMGIAYSKLGDNKSAKNCYIDALKIDPKNENVWSYLRAIYNEESNNIASEITYRKDLNELSKYLGGI